jgi:hypothetical protein
MDVFVEVKGLASVNEIDHFLSYLRLLPPPPLLLWLNTEIPLVIKAFIHPVDPRTEADVRARADPPALNAEVALKAKLKPKELHGMII